MGRKRNNQNKKKGRRNRPSKGFDAAKHRMPDPIPQREYEPDPITGEPITNVFTAIVDPTSGKPTNFETIIDQLKKQEKLEKGERIAYIGRGAFGIVKTERKDGKPQLVVRKRFQIEDTHDSKEWRKELSPGISRDYSPEPEPLTSLYSPDDLSRFPRFEQGGGGSYISRGN